MRLSHIAVTVPRDLFEPPARRELLHFYSNVFGWSENPALARPGERIFMRAPSDAQYLTIRASDEPMQTSGYEHVGVALDTPVQVNEAHQRADLEAGRDERVDLGPVRVLYDGHLHTFRVRYLLPLTIEVQCIVRDP